MRIDSIEEMLRSELHARVLRFLFAAGEGIDEAFLTEAERDAAFDLVEHGVALARDSRLALNADHAQRSALADALHSAGAMEMSELEQLRADHREIAGMLSFLQDLLHSILGCRSVPELFRSAFRRLAGTVKFDVACGVMLEQNLDLFVSRPERHDEFVSERLVDAIRRTLDAQISASFVGTDVIVRGDFSDVPDHDPGGDPLAVQMQTLLRLDNQIAGSLILYRSGPSFSTEEQRILDILSDQLAIVLGGIRANEQIQNLADTDDLTGIWNKRAFRRQLPSEVERARTYGVPLSLMLVDIDDFKVVNDTYGHVVGDVLLSELCGTVRETLRPPDVFARFGGDEFVVILPHTDLPGARTVAERMIKRVRELQVGGPDDRGPVSCTISIGIATLENVDRSPADFLQRADERLYDSKRLGKDRFTW